MPGRSLGEVHWRGAMSPIPRTPFPICKWNPWSCQPGVLTLLQSSNGCSDSPDDLLPNPIKPPGKKRIGVPCRQVPSWQRTIHPVRRDVTPDHERLEIVKPAAPSSHGWPPRGEHSLDSPGAMSRQESSSDTSLAITLDSSTDLDKLRAHNPEHSPCSDSSEGRRFRGSCGTSDAPTGDSWSAPVPQTEVQLHGEIQAGKSIRDVWCTPRATSLPKRHVPSWDRPAHTSHDATKVHCEPPPPPPPPPHATSATHPPAPGRLRPPRSGANRPPSWQTNHH
eukprot:GGOE01058891.1.p1 GENE.GGOE01058891.1~~GGOE01058891.1.p1  ORF type:complete len:279 (-),score=16.90 GGOE01058891.1:253-1089(-)